MKTAPTHGILLLALRRLHVAPLPELPPPPDSVAVPPSEAILEAILTRCEVYLAVGFGLPAMFFIAMTTLTVSAQTPPRVVNIPELGDELNAIVRDNDLSENTGTQGFGFFGHFTPTGGSWLNLVERWFAPLTEKPIKRGAHRSTRSLEAAILAYLDHSNTAPKPFVWTKTADEILASVARCCHRISGTGHEVGAA